MTRLKPAELSSERRWMARSCPERLIPDLPGSSLSGMATDLVQPFPDDAFSRVLCVVAHPDDVEYGTSSAVAAWTTRGGGGVPAADPGEAGMDASPPDRTAQLRPGAGRGVTGRRGHEVEFLEYRDGVLEYGLAMRRDIARSSDGSGPRRWWWGPGTSSSWPG